MRSAAAIACGDRAVKVAMESRMCRVQFPSPRLETDKRSCSFLPPVGKQTNAQLGCMDTRALVSKRSAHHLATHPQGVVLGDVGVAAAHVVGQVQPRLQRDASKGENM